jgi:RNA polymerase sigma-70 factor, ECF subfamily
LENHESEIIEKAIGGDAQAFRWLVEKYQRFAFSLAYRFLNSSSDAQDVTQEAFIRLWKHLPRYRFDIKVTTWLYKIITNLCLDQLKSAHRKHSRQIRDADYPVADALLTDQRLLDEEFKAIVIQMTEALTPKQKAVFILRDLEELPMKEISEVLTMSSGNVKSNLYYARIKMSKLIGQYYEERKTKLV